MAFGPHMEIRRPNASPIVLDAIAPKDWRKVPSIYSPESEPIRRYVTQKFIEEAATLKTPGLEYHHQLEDAEDSTFWGIYAKPRRLGRYMLIGFTGYSGIQDDPGLGRIAHSRMVLMNADFQRQRIGTAAGLARTYYGLHPNGDDLSRIRSRVDIRNSASYSTVYNEGYNCFTHTPPKGPEEPDWERHLLELRRFDVSLQAEPQPFHPGDSWENAQRRLGRALLRAEHAVRPLLD